MATLRTPAFKLPVTAEAVIDWLSMQCYKIPIIDFKRTKKQAERIALACAFLDYLEKRIKRQDGYDYRCYQLEEVLEHFKSEFSAAQKKSK